MDLLRTPEERFASLPEFPYPSFYVEVPAGDGGQDIRIGYVDVGPRDAPVVLLLHGEPSWSYLYRTVIDGLLAAGLRCVAPDLVGFGRSDKPASRTDHSYARHVEWMRSFAFSALDLHDVTLVGQDWGGLIGLRLVAEHGDRFARVVAANTGLPTGEHRMPDVWWTFRRAMETAPVLDIPRFIASGCTRGLSPEAALAYAAPFPTPAYEEGPRAMPGLVPNSVDDPAHSAQVAAWEALQQWEKPFLVAFSDSDPITASAGPLLKKSIPGAAGLDHPTLTNAGHFLQEDAGPELAAHIADFIAST